MKPTIFPITAAAPWRLAIVGRPRGGDWLSDELTALSREGVDVLVSMLTTEEAQELGLQEESTECKSAGITFVNIPVADRSVPGDRNAFLSRVDELAKLVRRGRFVGVHCRAGIGRSSVLAVSVLIRLGWDVQKAFEAVESARQCSIPDTPEQQNWVIKNIVCP